MTALRDRRILFATAFVRATTTSTLGVSLGGYLATLAIDRAALGLVISAGLAGAALAALAATFTADRVGRRRFLIAVTACGAAGTAGFALASGPLALAIAGFAGMVNGMGKDRGAALILEQAALPSTAGDAERTRVIAVYTMLQDVGHAAGALLAGLPVWLAERTRLGAADAHRAVVLGCAVAALAVLVLYLALGPTIEHGRSARPALSPASRAIITRISALFALDGLGGGFLTTALISYFFFERFAASEATIAALFFGARILNAVSHLGAAWLARRIGLVNTMVFSHIPSSLLLVTVAFAPSFAVAAVLFLLREGLVEMDVPTRQSYVLAVVRPGERTVASGITNLVRLGAWAVAPGLAGLIMTGDRLYLPLVIGAAMKISYDLLLWRAFRAVRPPEEAGHGA
ncbi:MAG: MFS transporter [Deltaproteobacteria bacterium]|nr:MAG: MFS transporter [Deltaproteobacteria bacterium]TMQ07542.1 MAG: MFS transporter [Deltaproteobacteria bacterium]